MNTDQGRQYASFAGTDRLKHIGIRFWNDDKARYLDSIFIERLWRRHRYDCIHLHADKGILLVAPLMV